MPVLYLLRHGCIETPDPKCFLGQLDVALSQKGLQQAEFWGKALSDVSFSSIWSSDLNRTLKTAEMIATYTHAPIFQVKELREIGLGQWDGQPMTAIQHRFPKLWEERGANMDRFRPPGGESFMDLHDRVVPFFHQCILAQISGNSLIVTHAGVIRVLLCHVLQVPIANVFSIPSRYAGLTVMDYMNKTLRVCTITDLFL